MEEVVFQIQIPDSNEHHYIDDEDEKKVEHK